MKKMNKVLMNSLLGGVIAMGVGTTGAYADDGTAKATTEPAAVTVTANAGATTSVSAPVLVPGHPFYFLKMFIEKIEIVLKTNDMDKAKLLTLQVEERLNEAERLFADGQIDLAMETMNKALQTQDRAVVTVIDTKAASEAANEVQDGDKPAETVQDDDEEKDKDKDEDEDEDKDEDKGEDQNKHKEADEKEIEVRLKHNIEALTKALEHVKNPTARAALARNIEKTLEKAIQTGEWSSEAAGEAQVTIEVMSGHAEDKKAAHEQAKAEKKAAHEQAKAAKKAAHEQAKAAKKAAHEQGKAAKKDAR